MSKFGAGVLLAKVGASIALASVPHLVATMALASPTGDTCRKDICSSAVSQCLSADQALNPFARTEAEKRTYCATFFNGCMTRSITPDLPWYSPQMLARFLQCPP